MLYNKVARIGKGGFSEVYHCISLKESKSVALKKVKLDDVSDDKLVMNEIELLRKLQDTNKVIKLYD